MPSKTQKIIDLVDDTAHSLSDVQNWTAFLKTAAWQYKYPFEDQLLIYAQRPDATACATLEVWNKKMNRWINKGAKGIALLRENANRFGLEYVFDVSDTHDRYNNEVTLWQYEGKYENSVIQCLEDNFGDLKITSNIIDAIMCAVHNAVEDNKSDCLHELEYVYKNSLLDGLDDVNLDLRFCRTAEASASYIIMERLRLNPENIFDYYDFEHIHDFNTRDTLAILASAVSSISEMALREISRTISAERKSDREKFAQSQNQRYNISENKNTERNDNNDGIVVQDSGRLSDTRPDSAANNSADRQVRNDEENISAKSPQEPVHTADDVGRAAQSLGTGGQSIIGAGTDNSITDGAEAWRNGGTQSAGSDEMDEADEQFSSFGGGVGNQRVGVQLSLFDEQLPTEEDRRRIPEAAEQRSTAAFLMPQQIIDEVIADGANEINSVLDICVQYSKNKSHEDNAAFLKKHYGTGGKGFVFNGRQVSAWWNDDGMRIAYGNTAIGRGQLFEWEQVESRIGVLLDLGRYTSAETLERLGTHERDEAARQFYNMYRELNVDEYPDLRDDFENEVWFKGGYNDITARLSEMMILPENVQRFVQITEKLANRYLENPDIMRYSFYAPTKALPGLMDLQLEHKHFTSNIESNPHERFITEDEINKLFSRGSSISGGKIRIYLYFQEHTDTKERINFLKKEYGTGGYSAGLFSENHDAKGIQFSRNDIFSPFAKVNIPWNKAVQRISSLIKQGRYMTEREINEEIPKYRAELEQQKILREKVQFLNSIDTMTQQERLLTLPKRIMYCIDTIGLSDRRKFESHGLTELIGANEFEIADFVKQAGNRDMLMDCLGDIQKGTADAHARSTAYKLIDDLNNFKIVSGNEHAIQDHGEIEKQAQLEKAKHLIREFTEEEYEGEPDFSDLGNIEAAYTTTEDDRHEIQAVIDLVNFSLTKYIDGEAVEKNEYESLPMLIESELESLDFSELVYVTEEQIKSVEEKSEYTDFYKQYLRLKSEHADEILMCRVGDFYEMFGDDAANAARVLEIALTSRNSGRERVPMCGIPAHALESSITALTENGYGVAAAEPLENGTYEVSRTVSAQNEKQQSEIENLIGTELNIDGRRFVIEQVHTISGDVSMRDITFESKTGIPISRVEKLDFVQKLIEQQKEPEQTTLPAPKVDRKRDIYDIHPEIPMSQRHDFYITDDNLGVGGTKEKFRRNIDAIQTLKNIESENRFAAPGEQEILSQYVGWGGLADAFDSSKDNWHSEYTQLMELLTDDEYASARESSLTAFYTPPVVIRSIYKALENMGVKNANILEPSCGVGNFIGMKPDSMNDCKVYGVELDSISGRIAQQLYQTSSIQIKGYEDTQFPDSFFDVAIGNVPFGDFKVIDKRYNKHSFLIHDYFFAKTLDKVRPGGIIAFVTSSGTMDKRNSNVRRYIAQRADLVGAVRLPNNTFKANAGTEVTSDILFLQKRDRMVDIEPEWVNIGTDENGLLINQYFIDNPDMILGEMKEISGPFGPQTACIAYKDADLGELLDGAMQNIHAQITEYELEDMPEEESVSIPADPSVKNFSYTIVDGDIYFRENSRMNKVDVSLTAANRIKGMIELRDCMRQLIEYQTEDYPDETIEAQQLRLNSLYNDFTKKYYIINSRGNRLAFSADSSYYLLCSLEVLDKDGDFERKADMFTKRTIGTKKAVTRVDTASEALAVSIGEKARIDMEFMSELTGKTEQEIFEDLKGVIFLNPEYSEDNDGHEKYLTADEYLSGNVRQKLEFAKQKANPDYDANIEALTAVQPKDLTPAEITVRLGTTWIPEEYINDFVFETLNTSYYGRKHIKVHYSKLTSEWSISNKSSDSANIKASTTYGTKRANAYRIIEDSLNLRDVRIFDYVENENGSRVAVLNSKETTLAQQKQELLKQAFIDWIWKTPERRDQLTKIYNERFNCIRPREYDGSHIVFNGMNTEIELRTHQKNAVARIMYGGNALLGHVVGAGKTWTMAAAAMEMKRLGLCSKSLFVVPNHLTEQWAAEFLQLYPAANILVATKKDFETANRKKFCGRIATGEYDAVIIGHSQFEKIPMSLERQREMLERQIQEILMGIEDAKSNNAENFTVKQMEKTRKGLEIKLAKLNDQSRKDDIVTFEELGVDRLFVDESHYYKNLYLVTKMRNVGGIAQTEAQKSSDMFMKCRYLDEITGGKGCIMATGTPLSNSMVEMYTIQRYLQYDMLVKNELQHFDAWASTFGETVTAIELAPEGSGYRAKTRFAKFFNLPELMTMFKEFADIQTSDMLKLPVPEAHFHNISAEPTEIQREMVAELSERAETVRKGQVDPTVDNMLKITNDGRKLALDQRMINPMLPDEPNTKVSQCAENVYSIWRDTAEKLGTQLVFCDLSTPKNDGTFNVYDDIKFKLIDKGIPEEQIAYIHEANTEVKKKTLFAKVREGEIRVLIGSTQKMGAGTNVQTHLAAIHDLDCPWRPSDLEQRLGRIVRQGNLNSEVDIYRYVTKDTFDAYMFQLVENKQKFIAQVMTSKSPVRSAEDIDETALSYAEIKALATGNPYIKEKMELDTQVAKLKLIKSNFMSQKYDLEDKVVKFYPQKIAENEQRIVGFEHDIELLSKYPRLEGKFYPMTIEGKVFAEKEAAGAALIERCKAMTNADPVHIGEYRGFKMILSFDTFSREHKLNLQGMLSHTITLGTDVFGNIQRIDNGLEGMPKRLEDCKTGLKELKEQFEIAKVESKKEFPQEDELQEKLKRLAALDALLNMDKRDTQAVDMSEPDEDMPKQKSKEMER